MDLIERYLTAVGVLLPRTGRADILAELRDVLINRREEKQDELGRPLTRDEDAALLRAFGHPISVAGRYGRQQYLIGPDLYPLYIVAVKVLVAIQAAGADHCGRGEDGGGWTDGAGGHRRLNQPVLEPAPSPSVGYFDHHRRHPATVAKHPPELPRQLEPP